MLAILVHELGHALGLLHSTNNVSTMWPFGGQQVLGEEDIAAIRALYGWSKQAAVPDVGTDASPVLCALPGELVLAWKGIDETALWFSRSADGQAWSSQNTMPGSASSDAPTLAWDGSRLWMAWRGVAGDTSLYWSTSFDAGRNWVQQRKIAGVGSTQGPSMTIHRGAPLLVWRGVDGDSGLFYTAWDGSGWLPQESVGGTGSTDRPAVSMDVNGSPRMVWRGISGDDDLYTSSMRVALPNPLQGFWQPQQHVSWIVAGNGRRGTAGTDYAASDLGPSLAALLPGAALGGAPPPERDRLYMTWRGVAGDQALYFTQGNAGPDGIPEFEWSTQAAIQGVGSSHRPAIALFQDNIHLAWKGTDDDTTIWHTAVRS